MMILFLFLQFYCCVGIEVDFNAETNTLTISGEGRIDYSDEINQYKNIEIEKLRIEEGIIEIGNGVFYNYQMKQIEITKTVKRIEKRAFSNCQQLESITFDQDSEVEEIEEYAFENCMSLKSFVIPKNEPSVVLVQRIQMDSFRHIHGELGNNQSFGFDFHD